MAFDCLLRVEWFPIETVFDFWLMNHFHETNPELLLYDVEVEKVSTMERAPRLMPLLVLQYLTLLVFHVPTTPFIFSEYRPTIELFFQRWRWAHSFSFQQSSNSNKTRYSSHTSRSPAPYPAQININLDTFSNYSRYRAQDSTSRPLYYNTTSSPSSAALFVFVCDVTFHVAIGCSPCKLLSTNSFIKTGIASRQGSSCISACDI